MSDPGTTPDDGTGTFRDDDVDSEHTGAYEPDVLEESRETVTNDAVAGETVEPQPGDGTDDGATGGAPREGSPDLWEHDDDTERPDLGDDLGVQPL